MLQPTSITCEIDVKYLQEYRLAKKKEKNSRKTKPTNSLSANLPNGKFIQQSQTSKKNQDYQQVSRRRKGKEQGSSHDSPATGVNIVFKKEEKDIT